jgi:hypothetical protein
MRWFNETIFATLKVWTSFKRSICMKQAAFILLFLIASIAGCKDKASSSKPVETPPAKTFAAAAPAEQSHNLIERYNHLLSEGYKTTDMTKLQEVTTPELAEKAYYHMAAIGEGKSRMVSELKKINFVETDCAKPPICRVVTKEWWDFGYADILTGKRSNEVKDYVYNVQYLVENKQGRWVITEISASGEERKEIPTWGKMFKKQ